MVPVPSGVKAPSGTEETVVSGVPEEVLLALPVLPEFVLPAAVPVLEPLCAPVLPEEADWTCAGFAADVPARFD